MECDVLIKNADWVVTMDDDDGCKGEKQKAVKTIKEKRKLV